MPQKPSLSSEPDPSDAIARLQALAGPVKTAPMPTHKPVHLKGVTMTDPSPSADVTPTATDAAVPDATNAINALQSIGDDSTTTATTAQTSPAPSAHGWEMNELSIASLILAYGVFAIGVSSWLMMRGKDSEAVLRMVGVLSAVVIASFLLVVGYDDKQMNPVIGLLGTIVGYLLGKDQGYNAGTRDATTKAAETGADREAP